MPPRRTLAPAAEATLALLTGLALLLVAPQALAKDGPKVLKAYPLGSEHITLDGKLDEPAWQKADVGSDFVERQPLTGQPTPVKTEVRVVHDSEAVYVGIRAELFEGETPQALTLGRDNSLIWSDEAVTIKFDVRNDKRTTVGVALNPAGAQLDFISIDNGRQFRLEYDAIWEAATHVAEGFWSVEVRLPVAALGLPAADGPRVIGFNVARDHNSRLADYDWAHLPPEFGPFSNPHYGELHGLEGMSGGMPLSLRPYALGSYRGHNGVGTDEPQEGLDGKLGGSAALRFADDIWAEMTLLTDFAQVDADDQVLNLNRFPLFFPERRPFFLSGLGVFDSGELGVAQPFFTRRIGRDASGQEVPILIGTKVYGSAGPFEFGLLDVVTDDTTELADDPADDPTGVPGKNWAVARARVNFASPGHVGLFAGAVNQMDVLVTDPEAEVEDEPHITLGVDSLLRGADNRLEFTTFGNLTLTDELDDEGMRDRHRGAAARAKLRWLGSMFQPEASTLYVDEEFDPQLGFVRRTGILNTNGKLPIVVRTTALGLSQVTFRQTADVVHDHQVDTMLGRTLTSAVEVRWLSGWGVDLSGEHAVDVPQSAFDLLDVEVQPDRYEGARLKTKLISPTGRNPRGTLGYTANDAFFGGSSHDFETTLEVSPNAHHRIKIGANLSLVQLSECHEAVDADDQPFVACGGLDPSRGGTTGPTHTVEGEELSVNAKLTVTPTTKLTTDLTVQLNTQTETAFGQLRARYRYMPGSDIFVVYQEQLGYGEQPKAARQYSAAIKLAYRYDSVL